MGPVIQRHNLRTSAVLVPTADLGLGPNTSYLPVLKKGSTFETKNGNMFTLTEDIEVEQLPWIGGGNLSAYKVIGLRKIIWIEKKHV